MKDISPSRLIFPTILIVLGFVFLYLSFSTGQNAAFNIGCAGIIISGIIYLLFVLGIITKPLQLAATGVLAVSALFLASLDYKSIKDPVDFMNVKKKRDQFIIQRLKDIRTAEIAYKNVKGNYTPNFDTLITFVKTDSFPVVKAVGNVPDTLTEEEAFLKGIIRRDTSWVNIGDSIFSAFNLKKHVGSFHLDSIRYIPFTANESFKLEAGEIERNNVKVKVFQATAPIELIYADWDKQFYDKEPSLSVGSMSDPSTSGNWGE